jgi:hypothetical protein
LYRASRAFSDGYFGATARRWRTDATRTSPPAVEDRVHVNDLHATVLKLLGLDHKKLTFLFEGRDQRLTDVGGDHEFADRLLR